jgi:hypothetical protein
MRSSGRPCSVPIFEDEQARRRVLQQVAQLRSLDRRVDRHGDGAEPTAAEHDAQEFGPVRAQDCDPVAGLHTGIAQRAGHACCDPGRLRECPGLAVAGEQNAIAMAGRLQVEQAR